MSKTHPGTVNFFGFDPDVYHTYFQVVIPTGAESPVIISTHLSWDGSPDAANDKQRRVELPYRKWQGIAQTTCNYFNEQLLQQQARTTTGYPTYPTDFKPAAWKSGYNLLNYMLGKELTLLAWAIEDAADEQITVALANWLGLCREERWWLYTQTAAATSHWQKDRNKGWRKAVRFALTENPVRL